MSGSSFDKGGQFVANLGDAVRRNPVATALIGMGLLWLFTGGKTVDGAARLARRTGLDRLPERAAEGLSAGRAAVRDGIGAVEDRMSSVTEGASALAESATRAVRETGHAALDRASSYGADLKESASDFGRAIPDAGAQVFSVARSRLADLFDQQPLMLGAVGIAIGAGIAASLPTTEIEAEYFGESSDEFKAKAAGFAEAGLAQALAKDAADRVAEETRRQGSTADGPKPAVGEATEKVRRAAEAADENLRASAE